ncbi:MAG: hypothetical protein A4E58_02125 [Syntrophorhabdus sp. PtaB.Bin006]|nr:MAG: hypothetical protein A4E58_02125 [Syntrophorhabdus sp. PtaB.Bin006]
MPEIPTSTSISSVFELYPCLLRHSCFTMCITGTQDIQVDDPGLFCSDTQSAVCQLNRRPGMIANHATHGARAGFPCFQ